MAFWTAARGTRRTLTLLAVAGSLGAQAPKCDIPVQSQAKLLPAGLMFNSVFKPTNKPEDKAKALAGTVKALTDDVTGFPAPAQPGRNFLLLQALLVWLEQPGTGISEQRGKIGYTVNPTGPVDLAVAIDSAMTAIRTAKPECADSLKLYTNGLWGQLINKAASFINEQALDSAELYARRSMLFDSTQFYAYNILANVAIVREDTAAMVTWFGRTIDVTAALKDTSAIKVRDGMLTNLAALYSGIASTRTGAQADSLNKLAVATYTRYQVYYPTDITTKMRIMRMSGTVLDSAGATRFVDEVLANVASVSDAQLADAGNELAKNQLYTAGLRLFEAALKKNPNSRDALYNSAVALNNLERFDELRTYFDRLKTIDPNNAGVYSLARNVQSARRLAIQTRANKGVKPRPGQQVMLTPVQSAQIKAINDSLVYFTQYMQNLTPTVDVRSFSPSATGATFGAVVQIPTGKPAAVFNIVVEFLDATGTIIATQQVTTKQIAAGGYDQISSEGKGAGIVAFRYRVAK